MCSRSLWKSGGIRNRKKKQRELFLRQISPLDFLIHSSSSPWSQSYKMCLWEQSRALHALLYWYMEEQDERLVHIMKKWSILYSICPINLESIGCLPLRLFVISEWGAIALGEIIDPLLKFDELFGDENARTLGVGLAYYCTDLSTGFLMRMEMLLEISCIDLVSQY